MSGPQGRTPPHAPRGVRTISVPWIEERPPPPEAPAHPLLDRWDARLGRLAGFLATGHGFAAAASALTLVAVLVRIPGAMASDYFVTGLNDAYIYYKYALWYWAGSTLPIDYHGSGWSLFLFLVLKVWGVGPPVTVGADPGFWEVYFLDYAPGVNERLVYLATAMVGAALVPAIALLGREVAGPKVGLAAALLLTVDPWLVSEASTGLSEPLYAFLLVVAAFAVLKARRDPRWMWGFGALAAAAHAVRPNGLIAFLTLVAWAVLLIRGRGDVPRFRLERKHLGVALLAFMMLTAPYLAWRGQHFESPMFYGPNTRLWADALWDQSDEFWRTGRVETVQDFFARHDVLFAFDRLYRSLQWQVVDTFGAGSGPLLDPYGSAFTPFLTAFCLAAFFLEWRRRELWIVPLFVLGTWATYAWMYPVLVWWDHMNGWEEVRTIRYFSPLVPFAAVAAAAGMGALARHTPHPSVWAAVPLGVYAFLYAPDALWPVAGGLRALSENLRFVTLVLTAATLMVLAVAGGEVAGAWRKRDRAGGEAGGATLFAINSRTLALVAPAFALAGGSAAAIGVFWPAYFAASVATVAVYVGTAGGPAVALPAGLALGLPLVFAAALLWLVDVALSLFFAYAVPVELVAARFPRIGRRLGKLHARVNARKGTRWGVLGAIAFWVGAPIHSGGAIVGTVTGVACGLGRLTTVGVVAAAGAVRMVAWALVWMGVWNTALWAATATGLAA